MLSHTVAQYKDLLDQLGAKPPKSISEIISAFEQVSFDSGKVSVKGDSDAKANYQASVGSFSIKLVYAQLEGTLGTLLTKLRERDFRNLTVGEGALLLTFALLLIGLVTLIFTGIPVIAGLIASSGAPVELPPASPAPATAEAMPTEEQGLSLDLTQPPATDTPLNESSEQSPVSTDQIIGQEKAPCIRAGTEFWYATWLPGDTPTPGAPRSRASDNLACYDFESKGFVAIPPDGTGDRGVRIRCGEQGSECVEHGEMRGIFMTLGPGIIELTVQIDAISILNEGEPPNDVDLIIGVGNPFLGMGRFAIFRLVNPKGEIHLCAQPSPYEQCRVISRVALQDFGQHVVAIASDDTLAMSLDGESLGEITNILEPLMKRLWIGYRTSNQGALDATITFPAVFNEALSAP